jgi:predicted nucleic acid-binding protein
MDLKNLSVDVNVILEILAKRQKWEYCYMVLSKYQNLYLSPTSVHIIYYFGKKYGLEKENIDQFLKDFNILNFNHQSFLEAIKICQTDMEDALQIAASLNNEIDQFFTLDEEMKNSYRGVVDFVE